MNDARMTIRLPSDTLLFAQGYARTRHISLSELVVRYFNRLKESFSGQDGIPASVRDVVGIIPSDIDVEQVYHEHLVEKYL
jgi:hypothetical protein